MEWNEWIIISILKLDKDISKSDSYRLIALIYNVCKILKNCKLSI